jgi:PAS domain S-box-containing protein
MKKKSLLSRKVQLAFGSAILTLLVVGAISYRAMIVSTESNRWVRHTHEVLENLQDLLSAMSRIESSYRGYVLTGQESFLESFRSNILSAEQEEATVRSLTADNPEQQRQLPALERLAAQKIQFGERVISLRRTMGQGPATEVIRSGLGERIMGEFQERIRAMQDAELSLLVQRDMDAKRRLGQTKTVLILGTVLGLLIAAAAGWSAQRESSKRGLAEEALLNSEVKFRGILESAPDAMVIADGQGRIVLVNAETERLFCYPREELVGQAMEMLLPERFRQRHPQHRQGYMAHPSNRLMGEGRDLRGLRKDNTEFPVEVSLSPLESAEGILVTAAIRDITEKKLAQEKTQQQQQLLQLIIESIADGVVVADCSGKFLLFNTAAKRCLGIGATKTDPDQWPEQYGTYLPDAVTPYPSDDLPLVRALRGENVDSTEVFIRNAAVPDGRLIDITGGPLRDEGGGLRGGVVVFHDITQRKKAEDQLVKTVAELKRSNEELQQFAYVASHDLQEPLRMVSSYTQLLAKRYKGRLDSEADEFIAYAVDGSSRMRELISDLLTYSRAGTEGKALQEISSEKALHEAVTNLRAAIRESSAVVTNDPLPAILTDDTQLTQVFQNLVGNAIKYRSAEVPRVHVSAAKNGGKEWIFSVRDNGLGIDPQFFDRIFVIFQRLHGREEFRGTGIGLAICKKIVERLGGRIWVESQPEKGSTFCFALPERDGK